MPDEHAIQWLGHPVRVFDAESASKGIQDYRNVIYRLCCEYEGPMTMEELFAEFLSSPASAETPGIIIGQWSLDTGETSQEAIQLLVSARSALPNLKGIFLGELIAEEAEISWIEQTDISPILAAYPDLEHFQVRGGAGLVFGRGLRHDKLKTLIVETGGMPRQLLQGILGCEFPSLEKLELWTGSDGYGWDGTMADLLPLLDGSKFDTIRSLGIRNCECADDVAAALQGAAVASRLESLDLSMGVLTDKGAQDLQKNTELKSHLRSLDVSECFLSDPVCQKLSLSFKKLNSAQQRKPDNWKGETHYYVAVGE